MTELIVALDCDFDKACRLWIQLRKHVNTFKIRTPLLMQNGGQRLAYAIAYKQDLFLDLKLYDTKDSVQNTLDEAVRLKTKYITIHEDCIPFIQKPANLKVISVQRLTDGTGQETTYPLNTKADGFVTDVEQAKEIRPYTLTGKVIVCPGIRLPGEQSDNHKFPATPREAKDANVDYIVVGRPIVTSDNPLKTTQDILEQLR